MLSVFDPFPIEVSIGLSSEIRKQDVDTRFSSA